MQQVSRRQPGILVCRTPGMHDGFRVNGQDFVNTSYCKFQRDIEGLETPAGRESCHSSCRTFAGVTSFPMRFRTSRKNVCASDRTGYLFHLDREPMTR